MTETVIIAVLLCTALTIQGATAKGKAGEIESGQDLAPAPVIVNRNGKDSDLELSQRNACPPGWSGFQSRCFLFVDQEKQWIEAEKYCIRLGGNLASVHSVSEYRFLQALTAGHSFDYPATWIGAFDAVKEGQWQWSDGTEFSYTRWNAEQPDNWHYNEHCVHMNVQSTKGWNDVDCTHLYPFICAIQSTGCRKTSR